MCTCARLVAAHIKSGMCSSESTLIWEANAGCVRVCQSVCHDERGAPSTNGSAVDHGFGGCNSPPSVTRKRPLPALRSTSQWLHLNVVHVDLMSHHQPKTHRPLNTSGSRYGQPLPSGILTPPLSGAARRCRLHCSRGRSVGFRLVFGSRGLSPSSTTEQTASPYKLPYLSQVADPPASPLRNCQKQESMFLISERPHHRALWVGGGHFVKHKEKDGL